MGVLEVMNDAGLGFDIDWWTLQVNTGYPVTGDPNFTSPDRPWLWASDTLNVPRSLRGVPVPVWARPVDTGMICHYHLDQMRWISIIAILDRDDTQEISLIDADGIPLLDPAIPPKVVCRGDVVSGVNVAALPANDFVDDPTGGAWTDEQVNMPLRSGTTFANSWGWRLRLDREPTPHWRLILTTARTEATPSTDIFRFGLHVHLVGSGSIAHSAYSFNNGGSSWDIGRYLMVVPWQNAGNVDSRDTFNGTLGDLNRPLCYYGFDDIAASTTNTLYLTTPNMLSTDTNVYSSTQQPMVQVLGNVTGGTRTAGNQQTWDPSSLGVGSVNNAVPYDTVNVNTWGTRSILAWSSGLSRWQLTVRNGNTSSTRSHYIWSLGVA